MSRNPFDNRPPRGPRPIGAARGRTLRTRVGDTEVLTRPMLTADAGAVREMHGRCSPESLRSRYFGPKPRLNETVMSLFTSATRGLTLVSVADGQVVAMSHLMDLAPGEAELAFLIEDAWQGRGLGRALLDHLVRLAPGRQISVLSATVYAANRRMLGLLTGAGAVLPRAAGGIVDVRLPLGAPTAEMLT
ncbi:GNAT family N-acetyltransferase [Acrocarpospora catenulata]|uniref:GNAT family N-acetyltransferase n=1 Tax=Acrocarpospora catenulata TaxID=2836182 RepID=UPI001BDA8790|nr:GNAT family N-acetyltransferase [Acrocarpospora catenulata]